MVHPSLSHQLDSSHLLLSSPALEPIEAPSLLACKNLEPSCNPNTHYSPSRKQELQTSLVSFETCCCLICVLQLTTAALPLQLTHKYNLHSHMGKCSLIQSPPLLGNLRPYQLLSAFECPCPTSDSSASRSCLHCDSLYICVCIE